MPRKGKQDGKCTYNVTFEARSRDHGCGGKVTSIPQPLCVLCVCVCVRARALVIQHAMRMRHIVVCSLPRSQTFLHIIS
jgi:hypothetical protein